MIGGASCAASGVTGVGGVWQKGRGARGRGGHGCTPRWLWQRCTAAPVASPAVLAPRRGDPPPSTAVAVRSALAPLPPPIAHPPLSAGAPRTGFLIPPTARRRWDGCGRPHGLGHGGAERLPPVISKATNRRCPTLVASSGRVAPTAAAGRPHQAPYPRCRRVFPIPSFLPPCACPPPCLSLPGASPSPTPPPPR